MTSPKEKRQPPPRTFSNYSLYHVQDAGLASISDSQMQVVPEFLLSTGPANAMNSLSNVRNIGFDFTFNNATYKQYFVTQCGWMVLCDPAINPTALSMSNFGPTTGYDTNNFVTGSFPSGAQHVILSPWATRVRLTSDTYVSYAGQVPARVRNGYQSPPAAMQYDPIECGVRTFNDGAHPLGRRLIVRWNGYNTLSSGGQVYRLKFDVVIYENGKIDFCYGPKAPSEQLFYEDFLVQQPENVFVGTIVGQSGSNAAIRDYSLELGYAQQRSRYEFGGYVPSGSFTDNGAIYGSSLFYSTYWPTSTTPGSRLVLQQPQPLRRVLRNHFQKDNSPSFSPIYDDGESVIFGASTSSIYPTTLGRFTGGKTLNRVDRNDLFSQNFVFSSNTSMAAAGQFLERSQAPSTVAFTENSPYTPDSNFYVSSSTGGVLDGLLSSNTRSKISVKVSLPVNIPTEMFQNRHALLFYNKKAKQWMLPPNSVRVMTGSVTGSNNSPGTPFNWESSAQSEAICFNASGHYANAYSNQGFGSYTQSNLSLTLAGDRAAGTTNTHWFSRNTLFDVSDDNTFTLPIDRPFAIEKIVIEMNVGADGNWFNQQTTSFSFGNKLLNGPAVTIGLFHVQPGAAQYKNLIMSCSITNTHDNTRGAVTTTVVGGGTTEVQTYTVGYLACSGTPTAVLTGNAGLFNSEFTGSVKLEADATVENGVTVVYGSTALTLSQVANFLSSSTIALDSSSSMLMTAPFGRSHRGFDTNARSDFGKEFANNFVGTIQNPFHNASITDSSHYLTVSQSIGSGQRVYFSFPAVSQQFSNVPSPYTVYPGDKLFLAAAKSSGLTSGVFGTGVFKLDSGMISMTIFGSYLAQNAEVESHGVKRAEGFVAHDVYGNDPVLDQRIGGFRESYSGSYLDSAVFRTLSLSPQSTSDMLTNFMAGNEVSYSKTGLGGVSIISNNSTNSDGLPLVLTSSINTNIFTRYSQAYQRLSSRVGFERFTKHTSTSERFYDTLVPSFTECAQRLPHTYLFQTSDGLGNQYIVVLFQLVDDSFSSLAPPNWPRSFPFEPIYDGVSRHQNIENTFASSLDLSLNPAQLLIRSTIAVGFVNANVLVVADALTNNSSASIVPSFTTTEDVVRMLYGFGNCYTSFRSDNSVKSFDFWQKVPGHVAVGPIIGGWKYGLRSGFAENSTCMWRPDSFGQFRDMLEQRPYAKFSISTNGSQTTTSGVVSVKFVDGAGATTQPENTWSSNLSTECTSSLPFFDGTVRNRGDININTLNQGLVTLTAGTFGNVTI